jgi:hypothetical protein
MVRLYDGCLVSNIPMFCDTIILQNVRKYPATVSYPQDGNNNSLNNSPSHCHSDPALVISYSIPILKPRYCRRAYCILKVKGTAYETI